MTDICSYDTPAAAPDDQPITANYPFGTKLGTLGAANTELRGAIEGPWHTDDNEWPIRDAFHESLRAPLNDFADNLSWFSRQFGDSSYGNVLWIGHVGGPPGDRRTTFHNVGRAIDISGIQWQGGNRSQPIRSSDDIHDRDGNWLRETHRRLVAVEACLRKYFGYVLNRYIDPNPSMINEGLRSLHNNHFHVDNGCKGGLRVERTRLANPRRPRLVRLRSCHYFIQDCINAFTDEEVAYDGIWGQETERNYIALLSDLGMECLDPTRYLSHYLLFLDYIIMHGLSDSRAGKFRFETTGFY